MLKSPQWLVNWLIDHTPACEQVTRMVSQSMEQPLSFRERIKVRLHFVICVWCERYKRQLLLLRDAMHAHDDQPPSPGAPRLSSDARERLKNSLAQRNDDSV